MGARLEPFNHVDVQCYTGRSLDIVTQAETVDAFGAGWSATTRRYTAGCAVLETADRLVAEEGEPALRVYLLVVGAIRALSGRERDPSLVLDAFFLRAMTHAGWAPAINDCARCAAPGPHPAFNVAAGGAVCACAARRARSPRRARRSCCSTRCCTASGDIADAAARRHPPRHLRPGRRAPAVAHGAPAALAAAGGAAGVDPGERRP